MTAGFSPPLHPARTAPAASRTAPDPRASTRRRCCRSMVSVGSVRSAAMQTCVSGRSVSPMRLHHRLVAVGRLDEELRPRATRAIRLRAAAARPRVRRRPPAGSHGTRSSGRSCPTPSAPAGATTVRPAARRGSPAACAAATSAAPGSATPGQPASDSSPMSSPFPCRREQRRQRGRRPRPPAAAGCRAPRSACGGRKRFQERARRLRRFDDPVPQACGRWRSCAPAAHRRRHDPEQVGNEIERAAHQRVQRRPARRRPRRATGGDSAISGRPMSAVGSSLAIRSNSAMPSASDFTPPAQS